jgi:hypothetical protein
MLTVDVLAPSSDEACCCCGSEIGVFSADDIVLVMPVLRK